jgi:hypothetical protein
MFLVIKVLSIFSLLAPWHIRISLKYFYYSENISIFLSVAFLNSQSIFTGNIARKFLKSFLT